MLNPLPLRIAAEMVQKGDVLVEHRGRGDNGLGGHGYHEEDKQIFESERGLFLLACPHLPHDPQPPGGVCDLFFRKLHEPNQLPQINDR